MHPFFAYTAQSRLSFSICPRLPTAPWPEHGPRGESEWPDAARRVRRASCRGALDFLELFGPVAGNCSSTPPQRADAANDHTWDVTLTPAVRCAAVMVPIFCSRGRCHPSLGCLATQKQPPPIPSPYSCAQGGWVGWGGMEGATIFRVSGGKTDFCVPVCSIGSCVPDTDRCSQRHYGEV